MTKMCVLTVVYDDGEDYDQTTLGVYSSFELAVAAVRSKYPDATQDITTENLIVLKPTDHDMMFVNFYLRQYNVDCYLYSTKVIGASL